jgi:hypothetical protein
MIILGDMGGNENRPVLLQSPLNDFHHQVIMKYAEKLNLAKIYERDFNYFWLRFVMLLL